jgi:hypothetical protein
MRVLFFVFVLVLLPCLASDHADAPLYNMSRNDLKITGLLSFVDGENLILILATHPSLLAEEGSYQFPTDVSFNFYIDYDSEVNFSDNSNNQLYGGTVEYPAKIKEDITISLTFDKKSTDNDDNSFTSVVFSSKNIQPNDLKVKALIRDDPFTFPAFHGQNVAAIVLSIPLNKLNIASSQTLLLWATVTTMNSGSDTILWEHVGRALRSQIAGRWEFNHYPPAKQQAYIGMPVDVMIFDLNKAARIPNGRALIDDPLAILCLAGDQEVCKLKTKAETGCYKPPYTGKNDKEFLAIFPYLPEPHQGIKQGC